MKHIRGDTKYLSYKTNFTNTRSRGAKLHYEYPSVCIQSHSPVQLTRSYSCGDSPVARGASSCSSISASRASHRFLSLPNRHSLQNCRLKHKSSSISSDYKPFSSSLSLMCSHYKRVNLQRLSEPSRCNTLRLIRTLETAPLFTNWPKCSENVWVHHVGERGGISALTFWTLPRFTNSSFWEGDRKRKRKTRDNECVTRK